MLTFFLLFDLPTQIVILSPIIAWPLVAPKWHVYLLVWGAVVWTIVAIICLRKYLQTVRADKARELPQGNWHWARDMPAARYAEQVRLYLHNFGWVALEVEQLAEESVTLSARKDRLQVLLRCLRDEPADTGAEIDALAALNAKQRAGLACLLLPAKPKPTLVREAAARGVQAMHLHDMAFIDDPEGPAAFSRLRGR